MLNRAIKGQITYQNQVDQVLGCGPKNIDERINTFAKIGMMK